MQRPGIRWRWKKFDRSRIPGIAHIHHRDAIAKHVTDIGMLSVDHDLHPISSPSLIRVSHKVNVFAWRFKQFMIHNSLFLLLSSALDSQCNMNQIWLSRKRERAKEYAAASKNG